MRVFPVEADGGPARRLLGPRRIGQATPGRPPAQVQYRVAGLWPVAGGAQEGEKFVAADIVFGQRESLHRDDMLRPLGIEAARFARRTAHDELAGGDSHHDGALRTFLEFARGKGASGLVGRQRTRRQDQENKEKSLFHGGTFDAFGILRKGD